MIIINLNCDKMHLKDRNRDINNNNFIQKKDTANYKTNKDSLIIIN